MHYEKEVNLSGTSIQATLSVMGQVFAEAFAAYTAALLRHLGGKDPKGGAGDMLRKFEMLAEELVPAVQEREGAKAATGERATVDDLRPVMMRNKLVFELRSRGITQAELARRVDMAPAAISRILKHPERSRLTTLRRIAKAVDVDLSDLV
jgi:DNA-binding Xre family transcriptional regulator